MLFAVETATTVTYGPSSDTSLLVTPVWAGHEFSLRRPMPSDLCFVHGGVAADGGDG